MNKQRSTLTLAILILGIILSACKGQSGTPAVSDTTATPDLCSPQNLPIEVGKVNRLMREFDDISRVASNLPQNNLYNAITDLSRVRRAAEDQAVPACLGDLKGYQLAHMNTVINTLVYFMGIQPGAPADDLNQGIAASRQLHDQYTLEMARLLGLTVVVPATQTPGAALTGVASTEVVQTAEPALSIVTNISQDIINIRTQPALDSATLGVLGIGLTATAAGKSADEQWILIEVPGTPGQYGWVYATLVQLSVPITILPVVTPAP